MSSGGHPKLDGGPGEAIRSDVEAAGYAAADYAGHSFCIGAATTAAQ